MWLLNGRGTPRIQGGFLPRMLARVYRPYACANVKTWTMRGLALGPQVVHAKPGRAACPTSRCMVIHHGNYSNACGRKTLWITCISKSWASILHHIYIVLHSRFLLSATLQHLLYTRIIIVLLRSFTSALFQCICVFCGAH